MKDQWLYYVLLEQQQQITPAIAESQISRLPLIVLTSDRPHELRSVGAPQAINQAQMFNNYVKYQFDMPVADDTAFTLDTVHYQMQIASNYLYGPHRGQYILTCHFESR